MRKTGQNNGLETAKESDKSGSNRDFSRRSFLIGISTISAGVLAACSNVVENDEQSENLSIKEKIYEILINIDPVLVDLVEKNLSAYLQNVTLPKFPIGESLNGEFDSTAFEYDDYLNICARKAAHLIYLDQQNLLPWKLAELYTEELKLLFGIEAFQFFKSYNKYVSSFNVPSEPEQIYDFIKKGNFIKETPEKTVMAVVDWFRYNAIHLNGSEMNDAFLIQRYGHLGAPTVMDLVKQPDAGRWLKINGCMGSVKLIKEILQVMGIPVEKISVVLSEKFHVSARFPTIDGAIFHGDDLHNFKGVTMENQNVPIETVFADYSDVIKVPENIKSVSSDLDLKYKKNLKYFEIAEKYLTDDVILEYTMFLEGKILYPPFKENSTSDIQERLIVLYQRIEAEIDKLGGLSNAIPVLQKRLNERFNSKS